MDTPPNNQENNDYDADSIQVLKGLEGVRKRPSMYIGDTSEKGLHHLIFEILDNSVDEGMAGYCDTIHLNIKEDKSIEISDNGRGIPIGENPEYKKPTPEVILEHLHAGGKFDSKSYRISGGLHGVGMSVVNALAEWLIVEIKRDGLYYKQKFSKGVKASEPEIINLPENEADATGTTITFYPDNEIFDFNPEEDFWNTTVVSNRVRELAFLNPNIRFIMNSYTLEEPKEYFFEGGLLDFVAYLNQNKKILNPEPIYIIRNYEHTRDTSKEDILIEVAMQYNYGYSEIILTFANTINTTEGGTHLEGFKRALTRVMNSQLEKEMFKKYKDLQLSGDDIREGLIAIISVKLPDPQFESQTKIKLGNPEIRQIVSRVVTRDLEKYLEEHPDLSNLIITKAVEAKKARDAAVKAKDMIRRKSALTSLRLPGKLADCSSKNPEECELFIVEGNSAGGSAKQGRVRQYQAILPLRGKILNVEKSRLDKIIGNKEIQAMINAIGVELAGQDGEAFDLSKLRYHKIIIMCDADVDGGHIETLLLTFFFRYMRPLIEKGHLYVALPPLFRVSYKKTKRYVYSEAEREKFTEELIKKYEISKNNIDSIKIQRYKGLGEMNPPQLFDTTMDINKRSLLRVIIDDFIDSDMRFTRLMGEDVQPRKKFIAERYADVKSLDI